jgi:AcrR family transcriptional regulator
MSKLQISDREKSIRQAAIETFARRGFNESTLNEISEKAGVSKNSIYNYFNSKKQILASLLESIWQELADDMIELAEDKTLDPLEKVDRLIDQTIDTFTKDPQLSLVFFNEHSPVLNGSNDSLNAHYKNYLNSFARIYNNGVRGEYIHENIDGRVFLFFIHGGLRNLIKEWILHKGIVPLETVRESLKYQVKHGILKW